MVAETSIDLVDCLERPSASGDIDNLSEVVKNMGSRGYTYVVISLTSRLLILSIKGVDLVPVNVKCIVFF